MTQLYEWSIFDGALACEIADGMADTLEGAKKCAMTAYVREYGFRGSRVDLDIEGWEYDADGHKKGIGYWIAGRSNEREGIKETFFQWRLEDRTPSQLAYNASFEPEEEADGAVANHQG